MCRLTVTTLGMKWEITIPEALRQAQLESIATLRGLTKEALGEAIAPVRLWAPFIVQQTGL